MNLIEIKEGKASLLIPNPKDYEKEGRYDPSWSPVFYNPKMRLNRDISVLALSVIKPRSVVDALSASGVRGIRYYTEIGGIEKLILNDKNPIATELIKKNAEKNYVNAHITTKDANSLLYEIKADFVDIDPFGSPAPFILSAINATINKGYVAFTATDLSALECSSKFSARRKYDLICERLSFSKELGIRGLIAKVIREGAIIEKAAYPIFSFYFDYYYRVFFRIENGAKKVDKLLEKQGYYYECSKCGYREVDYYAERKICPRCGIEMRRYGPAWTGELWNREFLLSMKENLKNFTYFDTFMQVNKLLNILVEESKYVSPYFRLDFIASLIKRNIPKREKMLECLKEASITHFDYRGIKTNKEIDEIVNCIKIN
ncbi:tRNA (guanine(26)-N(2))-dimethyltransferase [Sulfurisphaera ohwakuensis]|uniref:tRNA (guanine(26)-N(2))-dimethyltransferase n=1 Tax=Sulfurisphaera ohwakuensis TaxID=69656 RepID=A0A650CGY1_SULOH|nr:tRNA (guanine(26)-N(2))-dimethyltransferase [Sulfurisphaera ohwakuensis]MBB5252540.1 tRNA (guanine26-N2/guanine27-N2)-dimethyltransferase [Sulfurisphaera ohwakuensis]QGR17016.1 tRNA (guanine(26)-N(2))-dimethyltransferase [Sulfurisphaera ohwakuensis]